jgi:hypothetical protein
MPSIRARSRARPNNWVVPMAPEAPVRLLQAMRCRG